MLDIVAFADNINVLEKKYNRKCFSLSDGASNKLFRAVMFLTNGWCE